MIKYLKKNERSLEEIVRGLIKASCLKNCQLCALDQTYDEGHETKTLHHIFGKCCPEVWDISAKSKAKLTASDVDFVDIAAGKQN